VNFSVNFKPFQVLQIVHLLASEQYTYTLLCLFPHVNVLCRPSQAPGTIAILVAGPQSECAER
jgi:hypothetical protein